MTRARLSWVQQNYLRAETLTRANACLVDTQSTIALAQEWGGGEVSFDGELIRKDGMFVPKDLKPLNPQNLR